MINNRLFTWFMYCVEKSATGSAAVDAEATPVEEKPSDEEKPVNVLDNSDWKPYHDPDTQALFWYV